MRSTALFARPDTRRNAAQAALGSSWALLGARLLLAAVFLLAGIAKVGDPSGFAAAVRAFHLLPDPLVVPFALVLPWLEILAGLYLVAGFLTRMAAVAVAAMLVMFIVALLDALLTGNTAHPCGCFGSTSNPVVTALAGGDTVGWWDVIRDVILIGFSAALLSLGPGAYSIDAWLARLRGEVNGR